MNKKELMTWSLRIQNRDYRHDYEQYGNKITSIGLHDWDVDGAGNIAVYKLFLQKDPQGIYRPQRLDGNGNPMFDEFGQPIPGFTDATTYDRYEQGRSLFPDYIEPDMKRWPHIEYYMQMVCFGPETVSRLLDSQVNQDNFIANLKEVVALYGKDQAGNDLGYAGIEIDCEGSWSADKWDIREGDDVKFIDLLKKIKNEVIIDLHPHMKLRINAHAMWGAGVPDYYRFHNYKLFADSVDKNGNPLMDEVQIMTYDFSWSGSAPGPSTPLWWMEDVAEWVQQCFDPAFNPDAKCTIENVYLGGAGYGRRWPIYNTDTYASSVTYRNLVDWQNGYYIHHRGDGEMADQDFTPMNAFNDPSSDNQIMYNHQYDYYKAKYLKRESSMGQTTARLSSYNGTEYVTSYSKNQHMKLTGLAGITGEKRVYQTNVDGEVIRDPGTNEGIIISPGSEPRHNLWEDPLKTGYFDLKKGNPRRGDTITMELGGVEHTFQAYQTMDIPYVPTLADGVESCALSDRPQTVLTYTLNVASAGTYKVGALVSFPFYNFTKLNGSLNGAPFTIGSASLVDYYPLMFKGVHIWDLGSHTLNAGANTIEILGVGSLHGTVVLGFIASVGMELEVIGGNISASPTIAPFKKRDGTPAKLPNEIVVTNEVLQQAPRPVIMWEDYFSQFLNDPAVVGTWPNGTPMTDAEKTFKNSGLTTTTYYKFAGNKEITGGGALEERDAEDVLVRCYSIVDNGYSQGHWPVELDANGLVCAKFKPSSPKNGGTTSGQLILNYEYKELNISAEVQFRALSGNRAGVRFATKGPGTGYIFHYDFNTKEIRLVYELNGAVTEIASASMGDREIGYDRRITMRVRVSNGIARCTIGGINLFGDVAVPQMSSGGMGFYSANCETNLYMMSLGSTSKWETLERFSLIYTNDLGVEVEEKLGELSRPGITRDQWGYLNYSGLNEYGTRAPGEETGSTDAESQIDVSLDYVFKPIYLPTWTGKRDIKIKLTDAGMWYKMMYIGDEQGMSITYAGDEQSFNKAMNIAVYDYNCKGIGLWVLGQADPRIFETLPDVVPWHD